MHRDGEKPEKFRRRRRRRTVHVDDVGGAIDHGDHGDHGLQPVGGLHLAAEGKLGALFHEGKNGHCCLLLSSPSPSGLIKTKPKLQIPPLNIARCGSGSNAFHYKLSYFVVTPSCSTISFNRSPTASDPVDPTNITTSVLLLDPPLSQEKTRLVLSAQPPGEKDNLRQNININRQAEEPMRVPIRLPFEINESRVARIWLRLPI
jgi:hypothetical protein